MRLQRIPITVITGFLGSGKTTLVNHILASKQSASIGIVVNEFGEIGIDGQIIVADEQAIVEINNGCVCCAVRADLVTSVRTLLERFGDRLERLIIETSGLADPAPVLQTFLADPVLLERVELESVVTVIDALHGSSQLADDIAREQVAFADRLIINKTDASPERATQELVKHIRQINPMAQIDFANHSAVPVDALLGKRTFSLDTLLEIEPSLLDDVEHDHEHDTSIESCAIVLPGSVDPARFNRWINQLVQTQGSSLLRMKGVLNMHEEQRRLHFHSVHMLLDSTFGKVWTRNEPRENRFVAIGRNIDPAEIRNGLLGCMH